MDRGQGRHHEQRARADAHPRRGERSHVPHATANSSFKHERKNEGVTEVVELEGRGHSLTIDHGWREVCDTALEFVKRYV
ncbi:MAG TPA: hypothetical protein VMU39_25190 [Solirubrobacteraceae bacterium]|nr:hypothetical protein [Solirubrobacteraceae bacterium]